MKNLKFLFSFVLLLLLMISCGSDDDICESGEGTPRLKMMFKSGDKTTILDSIRVSADLGTGMVDFDWNKNASSVVVPLRVDDSPYTDLYIKTSKKGDSAMVRVNYTTKSIYVSPGCGVKKNYENLSFQLLKSNPVVKVESAQNFIENEEKTSLYLIF
ncbi:DUF6452 family protein [Chryseobacterium sp.]|uniref:DUF6452 family protein n=1 Tax=Chryseobacterium sp. TaxID=1871047 RepID=UPI00388F2CC0